MLHSILLFVALKEKKRKVNREIRSLRYRTNKIQTKSCRMFLSILLSFSNQDEIPIYEKYGSIVKEDDSNEFLKRNIGLILLKH